MAKKLIVVGAIIVVLLALAAYFYSQNKTSQSTTIPSGNAVVDSSPVASASAGLTMVYKGTSPCADCPGINVVLTLQSGGVGQDFGAFTMQETYQGRSVPPLNTAGTWTVDRGSAANPNATVYVLTSSSPQQVDYFLKVTDTTMRALDAQKKELPAPYNYTLTVQ